MALSKKDQKALESYVQALQIDAELIRLALEENNIPKAQSWQAQLVTRLGLTANYFELRA